MPIKDASGDVVGVAQVINKLGGEQCFTANDEKVSKTQKAYHPLFSNPEEMFMKNSRPAPHEKCFVIFFSLTLVNENFSSQ